MAKEEFHCKQCGDFITASSSRGFCDSECELECGREQFGYSPEEEDDDKPLEYGDRLSEGSSVFYDDFDHRPYEDEDED
ncbi:MAG: hypothetical protein GY906_23950 [bacterium]|nr:hypothetical protein [bacterium]